MKERTYEASEAARRKICDALKIMMEKKPLSKISIGEIMRTCGMARQHFYYHFDNIDDLVHWMFDQETAVLLRTYDGMQWQDGLLHFFQYLQMNREMCLCALHSMCRDYLKRFLETNIHAIIQSTTRKVVSELRYPPGDREPELLTRFYVGALVGVMEDWLLGELQESPEALIQFVDQMLKVHIQSMDCQRTVLALPTGQKPQ